jgi:signal transduction histidine kinase/pSer/pThr/pTyr-binding forkhead associated (FHA) protein
LPAVFKLCNVNVSSQRKTNGFVLRNVSGDLPKGTLRGTYMTKTKLIISGPVETKEVLLDPKGTTLGRGSNCDVILDDAAVSRLHARISQDPFGRWIVEDLDSQNGVLIEGKRIKAQAVLPNQTINIRPFNLSISQESGRHVLEGTAPRSTILLVETAADQDIVSYKADQASVLSPALIHDLNELTSHLLKLSSPAELYSEACQSLAKMLDTLVAIVRLPCNSEPLPIPPDVLAFNFGSRETDSDQTAYLHFSKRVLEAVRSTNAPVMAGSGRTSDQDIALTIVDEHKPHVVFSARVNDLGETTDALYIDILQDRSTKETFDFVEAAARQINFVQKNLFFIELQKQEKALREANIKLKEKDRIKDEYVSRVTHDIKGHLAAIQSCLYIASDESSGTLNEKQSNFMQRATKRTSQLTTFVKELLNLTQIRLSGRMEMEAFSLPDTMSKALAGIANRAKEKSITVTSNIEPSVGQIIGNEFSINEMITNLLFNAVKYTPENKTVHLDAKCNGDHVQIDIIDTGIGIPAEDIANVFDEFFRAGNARKNEKDGTGLGLSIVKQIIEQHGGEISVESQEGQGTKFTVIMPKDGPTTVCT